jgi:mono/diheme cytochrome c family protein
MKKISPSRFAVALVSTVVVAVTVWAAATADAAKNLDGAKVYAANCGNCHSERYPSERNDKEWSIIVMHMRVRANLTGAEARAVLEYLQANNKDDRQPVANTGD